MAANRFRKEVEFDLGDLGTVAVRPTLSKIAQIESTHGPAMMVLRRIANSELGVAEMTKLVALIVRGSPGLPSKSAAVEEAVFALGAFSFVAPISDFIAGAITTDQPAGDDDKGASEGN